MFELKIALRYLLPKKRSFSTALISLLSSGVIALVVWLVLVFLSVTTGIEKNWLHKLTSLYAPVRMTPTEEYYRSYYYRADAFSSRANYTLKTIGEKAVFSNAEQYQEEGDPEISGRALLVDRKENGELRDLVQDALRGLNELKDEKLLFTYQDYEIGGALLRLTTGSFKLPAQEGAVLSQMSYLLSLAEKNPLFADLVLTPSLEDLNNLLHLEKDPARFRQWIEYIDISELSVSSFPATALPENVSFLAFCHPYNEREVFLETKENRSIQRGAAGLVERIGDSWKMQLSSGKIILNPHLRLASPLFCKTKGASQKDLHFEICAELQGHSFLAQIPIEEALFTNAQARTSFQTTPTFPPPWAIVVEGRCSLPSFSKKEAVLLPRSYQDHIGIGDTGTLSFAASNGACSQEQRLSICVAGFYDPGLFSLGGKCIIVPFSVTRAVHATTQTFSPDGTPTNGIFIWTDPHGDPDMVKQKIEDTLFKAGLSKYWDISTYKDYEFSKELFQQFQSDRTLFLLISTIILLVACCNIISLLILLVNDKKREIAILRAMGASRLSIGMIFGFCGMIMGLLSSLVGTLAAFFTLRHLDLLVSVLSSWQGHAAFQPAFFGSSLPNQMSPSALIFVLTATPLISCLAGLIPARKAGKIRPVAALRQG